MDMQNENSKDFISEENQALLDKQGWFYQYEELDGSVANIHTHGLAENLNHIDLQLVLKLDKEMAEMLLHTVIDNIAEGYKYREGRSDQVIDGIEVEFKLFEESDRMVLRLILPDEEGRFPSDEGCQEPYNKQYVVIED
ncbi:DUF4262 domain-containing protein [Bacillus massiliigorillae]|uniref:DUF4262 domain-containing protein n=1 Tax=Bacillus massiliigorillae TaxID=1243664 RepID=UPI0003A4D87D|nr:DUF4262 domain-containing protein [Bacillus massiliigorillae]